MTPEQPIYILMDAPVRIAHGLPTQYRLAVRGDGAPLLQGGFQWQEGNQHGIEWRDLPTVVLDEGEKT